MTGPANQPGGSWSEFVETRPNVMRESPARPDVESTLKLPPYVGAVPRIPKTAQPEVRPPALIGRFAISLGGLLAAGCAVLGVALVVLAIVVPGSGGTGLDFSTGPGWPRALWHLGVGAAGETAVQLVRHRSRPARVAVAVCTTLAVLLVLTLSWWR